MTPLLFATLSLSLSAPWGGGGEARQRSASGASGGSRAVPRVGSARRRVGVPGVEEATPRGMSPLHYAGQFGAGAVGALAGPFVATMGLLPLVGPNSLVIWPLAIIAGAYMGFSAGVWLYSRWAGLDGDPILATLAGVATLLAGVAAQAFWGLQGVYALGILASPFAIVAVFNASAIPGSRRVNLEDLGPYSPERERLREWREAGRAHQAQLRF